MDNLYLAYTTALTLKKEGNDFYEKHKDYWNAYHQYTQALQCFASFDWNAFNDAPEIKKLYLDIRGNRSKALHILGFQQLAFVEMCGFQGVPLTQLPPKTRHLMLDRAESSDQFPYLVKFIREWIKSYPSDKNDLLSKYNTYIRERTRRFLANNSTWTVPYRLDQRFWKMNYNMESITTYFGQFWQHVTLKWINNTWRVFAARAIRPGEVFLVDNPLALAIHTRDRCSICCAALDSAEEKAFECPCTQGVRATCSTKERYCSRNCQHRAWQEYGNIQCSQQWKLARLKINISDNIVQETYRPHHHAPYAIVGLALLPLMIVRLCAQAFQSQYFTPTELPALQRPDIMNMLRGEQQLDGYVGMREYELLLQVMNLGELQRIQFDYTMYDFMRLMLSRLCVELKPPTDDPDRTPLAGLALYTSMTCFQHRSNSNVEYEVDLSNRCQLVFRAKEFIEPGTELFLA